MPSLTSILGNINAGYSTVLDLITDKFNFTDEPNIWSVDDPNFSFVGYGDAVVLQADGKVLVGGQSGLTDGGSNYSLVKRFNTNGTVDETFAAVKFGGEYNGFIRDIKLQSNGKIIVVGHFTSIDGVAQNSVVRLNTDGTVDNTFVIGSGLNDRAVCCHVLSDDSVLIGGNFGSYDGNTASYIVKLGVDGAIDSTFTNNAGTDNNVFAIAVDGSGGIYIGGDFTNRIKKMNSDGTTDGSFDVGTGFNRRVSSIAFQTNGKVIVGGWFESYKNIGCNAGIVRLETNGDLDATLACEGTGLNNWDSNNVQVVKIQSDGKIVVGGWFVGYNDTRQGRIIRLNSDGTKDGTFVTGVGFNERVQDLVIDGSGNIYVAGMFNGYNGKNCTSQFNYGTSAISTGCAKLNSTGTLVGTPLKFSVIANGVSDGGRDMWDGGCFFNTDLNQPYSGGINEQNSILWTHSPVIEADTSSNDDMWYDITVNDINYSATPKDGTVVAGTSYFGTGSSYFTNMYPGLAVLGASNISIDEFSITGGTGQDGGGSVSNGSFDLTVGNNTWGVFYKACQNSDGGEPSIHHIIMVKGGVSGVTQTLYDDTNSDDDVLTGLTGKKELYVLIFGTLDSVQKNETEINQIATAFLELVGTGTPIVIRSCSAQACAGAAFKCLKDNGTCTCAPWKYYRAQCSRIQQALGICSGTSGAWVPAITVCNMRLF
jgi:uncharacterized delta-60 repeat protein